MTNSDFSKYLVTIPIFEEQGLPIFNDFLYGLKTGNAKEKQGQKRGNDLNKWLLFNTKKDSIMSVLFLLLASGFSVTKMLVTMNHMGFWVINILLKIDPTRRDMHEPTLKIDIPKK